jgi:hypothetical protein
MASSYWSNASTTLIPKAHNSQHLADLRPISVTPISSRLTAKFIARKWLTSAIPYAIIADQFAFRPTGSATPALVHSMHHATKFLESISYVRCLLIDFSKALDIFDRAIIVKKVSNQSLLCNIINWLKSHILVSVNLFSNAETFIPNLKILTRALFRVLE